MPNEKCAAPCGLYCGACPEYPEHCHGCQSDLVREQCQNCPKYGFIDCIRTHQVRHCGECAKFPCERLLAFAKGPVINGVCNHAQAIADLRRMKEIGRANWLEEKKKEYTCPKCGKRLTWFDKETHLCQP